MPNYAISHAHVIWYHFSCICNMIPFLMHITWYLFCAHGKLYCFSYACHYCSIYHAYPYVFSSLVQAIWNCFSSTCQMVPFLMYIIWYHFLCMCHYGTISHLAIENHSHAQYSITAPFFTQAIWRHSSCICRTAPFLMHNVINDSISNAHTWYDIICYLSCTLNNYGTIAQALAITMVPFLTHMPYGTISHAITMVPFLTHMPYGIISDEAAHLT